MSSLLSRKLFQPIASVSPIHLLPFNNLSLIRIMPAAFLLWKSLTECTQMVKHTDNKDETVGHHSDNEMTVAVWTPRGRFRKRGCEETACFSDEIYLLYTEFERPAVHVPEVLWCPRHAGLLGHETSGLTVLSSACAESRYLFLSA